MQNQSELLKSNSQLSLLDGVYLDDDILRPDSDLGNAVLSATIDLFKQTSDRSLFSLDFETRADVDELTPEIASARFNFLQVLNLASIDHALEFSEDSGGVAHFLSDNVKTLDSVKIDRNRSKLATVRCANKRNIWHICEAYDKLNLPEQHYDLIVIGAYEALHISPDLRNQFFCELQRALTPRGVLVLNAKNRNCISKWLNPATNGSESAVPFQELYQTDFESEFERKELLDILASCNFNAIDFNASFSRGDNYQNVFSEDYLTSNLNALNHFYRLGMIENSDINEYLLFKNLFASRKRIFDLASRFLVIAGSANKHTRRTLNQDFAHFAGTGRLAKWRTTTQRQCAAPLIEKKPTYHFDDAEISHSSDSGLVVQNLESQPFAAGRLLVDYWLAATDQDEPGVLTDLVKEYSEWLQDLTSRDDFSKISYDLLPFNVVIKEKNDHREYQMIDTEWQINADFGVDFLVFRALFYFAFENKAALRSYAYNSDLASIGVFILRHHPALEQPADLTALVQFEERIQAEISNDFHSKSVEHSLLQSFNSEPLVQNLNPKCQVMWGDRSGRINDEQRITVALLGADEQSHIIELELPQFTSEMAVLRIEPVISRGVFTFNSVQLFDQEGRLVWGLDSAEAIQSTADTANVGHTDTAGCFVALSDGPVFAFDLTGIEKIAKAKSMHLDLCLQHSANYDVGLASLTRTIKEQNMALVRQAKHINEYRFDKASMNMVFEDMIEHRNSLTRLLERNLKDRQQQVWNSNQKLIETNDHMVIQAGHMQNYLMMRPSARIKHFLARKFAWFNKNSNHPADSDELEQQTETNVDPFGLPDNPDLLGQNRDDYQLWISQNDFNDQQIAQAREDISNFKLQPLISIVVPVYNTDPEYLIPMIRSVQAQIYSNWQLCLVDDASPKSYLKPILEHEASQDERISIQINEVNQGISLTTNDAIALAKGDYIGLLDHDDELSIDALFENVKAINEFPDVGLLYSDEDKMDLESQRLEPFFKPDYSPDLLQTNNYICHFTVIKKAIINDIGGFREGLDGSQDHDIIMRSIDKSERVIHIPKILYHWRKIPGSTAVVYDSKSYAWEAGRKATENLLQKKETGVRVEFGSLKGTYRVFREIQGEPLISIVIPFKDKPELLDACLDSILNRSTYDNFEIIGVSNNSEEDLTFARMQYFQKLDNRIRFVEKNVPFNFSEICNYGVEQSKGEYIVLLNNDIEIISPDWIQRLLEHAQRPGIGAVGGKLLYPDGRIQHAGVVVGMVGAAGHPHKYFPDNHIGYHGRLHMVYNVSAVTGAMLMVSKQKYQEVGGLDQTHLAVAYNDVDFCLKLLQRGYTNLFTPHCKATHYESISRGYEDNEEKLQRFEREQKHFLDTWKDFIQDGDPYYNPNLSLDNEYFSLNFH